MTKILLIPLLVLTLLYANTSKGMEPVSIGFLASGGHTPLDLIVHGLEEDKSIFV